MPSILSKQSTIVILIIALALCVVTTTLAEPYNFKYSLKKRSSRLLYKRQAVDPKIPVSPAVTSSTTTPIANSPAAVNTKTVLTSVTLTSVVPAKTSKKTSTLDDGSTTVVETVEPAKTVVVVTAVDPSNQSTNTDQPSEDVGYDSGNNLTVQFYLLSLTTLFVTFSKGKDHYKELVEEQGKTEVPRSWAQVVDNISPQSFNVSKPSSHNVFFHVLENSIKINPKCYNTLTVTETTTKTISVSQPQPSKLLPPSRQLRLELMVNLAILRIWTFWDVAYSTSSQPTPMCTNFS
nr:13831_t:CDS:2 [Entrophospora candida]